MGPLGNVRRFENSCDFGTPDVHYTLRIANIPVSGWLELKILAASGRAPEHLTLDQVLWGRAEVAAGGRWHMLCRAGRDWLLYDVEGAAALFRGDLTSIPIFRHRGKFPLAALIAVIRTEPMSTRSSTSGS